MASDHVFVSADHRAGSDAWTRFASAADVREFCGGWLSIQCASIDGVDAALMLWEITAGSYAPAGIWPDPQRDVTYLAAAARRALAERRGLALPAPRQGRVHVAYPFEIDGKAFGVAVFDVAQRSESEMQQLMRQLHWGAGWPEAFQHRGRGHADSTGLQRATAAAETLALAGRQDRAHAAMLAVANDLAHRLPADRVAVSVAGRSGTRLTALSNSAWFDRRAQFVAGIENAMDEALDQGASICFPALPGARFTVDVAHEEHCKASGSVAMCSVILPGPDGPVGVVSVERHSGAPFSGEDLALLETVALLLGPAIAPRIELERWFAGRLARTLRDAWSVLVTPGRPAFKAAAALGVLAVLALAFAEMEFRVTAKSVVEGMVQRAAVAPFKGFVATAPVRAGERVASGQTLATMDDRDLVLERARWASEREQAEQKQRDAMAKKERATALVLAAQSRQAQAQLALVEARIERSRIVAPVDGLVVTGDLSQLLGSPVEQGQVLFEIAPLDAFRVIVQVDERDIAWVRPGQRGTLVLTGKAGDPVGFEVLRVSSVSEAREGGNTFRIEAGLDRPIPDLRPGMEGVAKISAGERRVVWIWTRRLVDWVRIAAWRWLP